MRSRRNQGYTFIEVLMAMGVMTIGAMGVMALQKATAKGNIDAREMTTAATVARTWVERLRRDALLWNAGGPGAAEADLTRTLYLRNVPGAGTAGAWFTPVPPINSGESYAFDYFGEDTLNGTPNTGAAMFCVNARLQWMFPGQAIRADVRVWWHRMAGGTNAQMSDRRLYANCGVGQESAVTTNQRLRSVAVSTVLRWSPLGF
jgi:prepilin-type N-terminal cleavage/methylation domain-containing protein